MDALFIKLNTFWINEFLTYILNDAYVKHEWYEDLIIIYGTKDGYAKICEQKEAIVKGLSVRLPDIRVRFARASEQ